MRFYLGTHEVSWLERTDVPLFISHRRLAKRKRLPRAKAGWALDSGAFSEIAEHGRWRTSEEEYVEAVARYSEEIGSLEWAAPMDWMCEPEMIERTGLTVRKHQERTVENFLSIRDRGPFIPVLQGWEAEDYLRHWRMYEEAGVDLTAQPLVGVGTVCRRQDTSALGKVLNRIGALNLHGFGVKLTGLERYGHALRSADSLAWSFNARKHPPLPGHTHQSCANCLEWALRWRESVLRAVSENEERNGWPQLWEPA